MTTRGLSRPGSALPGGVALPPPATLLLCAGVALVAVPTLIDTARGSWVLGSGSYGVFVLFIGVWLVARRWPAMRAAGRPGNAAVGWSVLGLALAANLVGRLLPADTLEMSSLFTALLAALYLLVGWPGLRAGGFPLFYLALAMPLPPALVGMATGDLRLWLTGGAVRLLGGAGLMIASEGLVLYVDQYRIAVEEACSGINSMVSLSAIGLFYVYAQGRRLGPGALALVIPTILACAALGNFVRVLTIILMTHFFGEEVAQGPLHEAAGIVTFVVSLVAVMLLDAALLSRMLPRVRANV